MTGYEVDAAVIFIIGVVSVIYLIVTFIRSAEELRGCDRCYGSGLDKSGTGPCRECHEVGV